MNNQHINIKYQDMDRRDEHNENRGEFSNSYIETIVKEIQAEAPSGAILEAVITHYNNFYKGVIHIQSSVGPFFGVVAANTVEDVGQKLLVQMKNRLSKWKANHFYQDKPA